MTPADSRRLKQRVSCKAAALDFELPLANFPRKQNCESGRREGSKRARAVNELGNENRVQFEMPLYAQCA